MFFFVVVVVFFLMKYVSEDTASVITFVPITFAADA